MRPDGVLSRVLPISQRYGRASKAICAFGASHFLASANATFLSGSRRRVPPGEGTSARHQPQPD